MNSFPTPPPKKKKKNSIKQLERQLGRVNCRLLKQQRRKAKQLRRKVRQQQQALPKHAVDIDVTIEKGASELVASDVQVDVGEASTSGREHAHETGAVPLAGRKRDLDSSSDSGPAVMGDSDALAIVPLTPDDDHWGVVRRSLREHKKPKPYFEVASSSLPMLKAKQGLKVSFFK